VHEHAELVPAPFPPDRLNEIFSGLERDARDQLRGEGFDDDAIELRRLAEMKFSLQIHQVEVPVPGGQLTAEECEAQVERFIERYEQTYGEGSAFPGAGTQIGLFRVLARGRVRTPALPEVERRDATPSASREVYWREHGRFRPTDIYDVSAIGAGSHIEGPAVVELPDTTAVIPPGASADVDTLGSIVIDVGVPAAEGRAQEIATA
jgi:N-methylhydantoinase A